MGNELQDDVLSHTSLDHLDHVVIGENLLSGKPFGAHRNRQKKNELFHTSTALSAARRHFLENNLLKCQPIPSCLRLPGTLVYCKILRRPVALFLCFGEKSMFARQPTYSGQSMEVVP